MTVEPPSSSAVVSAHNVTRRYEHGRQVLGGITDATLVVNPGEMVGIRGPSGAGKSTLLRLLSGVEAPDSGRVAYCGVPAWTDHGGVRAQRRAHYPRPGFVMPVYQDPYASLDPRWPVWRTMTEPLMKSAPTGLFPWRSRKEAHSERRGHVRELLRRSGMGHIDVDARPGELSGGQCQRIAILRALIAKPALIVADEPTARQDVITAAAMTEQLRDTAAAGTALVVVSHNAAWLESFADRVLEIVDGRLVTGNSR